MENRNLLPDFNWDVDPSTIERQNLLAIQAEHNAELRAPASGIFDKALTTVELNEDEIGTINDLTLATVHVVGGLDRRGNQRRTFQIRFVTPRLDQTSEYDRPHVSYVDVAHLYPSSGLILVTNGFTEVQGMSVVSMANDLHDARNAGTLANLSDTLSTIDPLPL